MSRGWMVRKMASSRLPNTSLSKMNFLPVWTFNIRFVQAFMLIRGIQPIPYTIPLTCHVWISINRRNATTTLCIGHLICRTNHNSLGLNYIATRGTSLPITCCNRRNLRMGYIWALGNNRSLSLWFVGGKIPIWWLNWRRGPRNYFIIDCITWWQQCVLTWENKDRLKR